MKNTDRITYKGKEIYRRYFFKEFVWEKKLPNDEFVEILTDDTTWNELLYKTKFSLCYELVWRLSEDREGDPELVELVSDTSIFRKNSIILIKRIKDFLSSEESRELYDLRNVFEKGIKIMESF